MEEKQIIIYEEYNVGTSIDIIEQQKMQKQGKRPIGFAKVVFDEAVGKSIYYTIERVVFFDSVRLVITDKFQRWNYCIYRINGEDQLLYDRVASERSTLDNGKITNIRFFNEKEELTYEYYNGAEYRGKI